MDFERLVTSSAQTASGRRCRRCTLLGLDPQFRPPFKPHQPKCDGGSGPFHVRIGPPRQMKMRRAVAGVGALGVTAEGDGFVLLVATIRVAAVAAFELEE